MLLQVFSCLGLLECKESQGEQQWRHVSENREYSVCQKNSQEETAIQYARVLLLGVNPTSSHRDRALQIVIKKTIVETVNN